MFKLNLKLINSLQTYDKFSKFILKISKSNPSYDIGKSFNVDNDLFEILEHYFEFIDSKLNLVVY